MLIKIYQLLEVPLSSAKRSFHCLRSTSIPEISIAIDPLKPPRKLTNKYRGHNLVSIFVKIKNLKMIKYTLKDNSKGLLLSSNNYSEMSKRRKLNRPVKCLLIKLRYLPRAMVSSKPTQPTVILDQCSLTTRIGFALSLISPKPTFDSDKSLSSVSMMATMESPRLIT